MKKSILFSLTIIFFVGCKEKVKEHWDYKKAKVTIVKNMLGEYAIAVDSFYISDPAHYLNWSDINGFFIDRSGNEIFFTNYDSARVVVFQWYKNIHDAEVRDSISKIERVKSDSLERLRHTYVSYMNPHTIRKGDTLIQVDNDSASMYVDAASRGDTDNMIRWMGKEANTDEMFKHYIKLHKKWLIENYYLITKNTQ